MIVNLFDAQFTQSQCSTAHQVSREIEYIRGQTQWDGVTLFTDGYISDGTVDRVESKYKIAWLREPQCLHPDYYQGAIRNAHKFDAVLTYHQPLLTLGGPFRFIPYGGVWIDKNAWAIHPKQKLCSMLVGEKRSTRGHLIRHEAVQMIKERGFPVDFYGKYGTPVGYGPDTKFQVLADYAFSICTETCMEPNLFTEWLLDCFAVGTIPIYWGCPNFDNFFNPVGVMWWNHLHVLERWLEKISMQSYNRRYPAVEGNWTLFHPYAITEDWLFKNYLHQFL